MPKNSPTYNKLLPQPCPTNPSPIHILGFMRKWVLGHKWDGAPTYLPTYTKSHNPKSEWQFRRNPKPILTSANHLCTQTLALFVWTSDCQPQSELMREARSIQETEDKRWFCSFLFFLCEDSRGRAEHLNLDFPAQLQIPPLLSFTLIFQKNSLVRFGTTVGSIYQIFWWVVVSSLDEPPMITRLSNLLPRQ